MIELVIILVVVALVLVAWAMLKDGVPVTFVDDFTDYTPRKTRSDKGKTRGNYTKRTK